MIGIDDEKRAVKQYLNKLPQALKTRYGGSGESGYTAAQVQATVSDLKLSSQHVGYAILIFSGEETFQAQGATSEQLLRMTELLRKVGSGGDHCASDSGLGGSFGDSFYGGGGDGGGGD